MKKARGTRGAIDDAIQGIRWGHDFNGFPTPTNNKFVARVAEGCKRLCTPVKKQRDFLTQEDILELTNSVDRDDIAQLRFIVIILLGFAGFLRISDILNLKVRNLEFDEQKLKIHIERSKNDQLSIGNDIYINRSGNQSCPVSFIRDYLLKGFVDLKDKNIFLIGKLKKSSGILKICGNSPLTYSRAREVIIAGLKPIQIKHPNKVFGTHSLRIGGASEANRLSANFQDIKNHGRWRSDENTKRYIRTPIENKLNVTKILGL